MEWSPEIEAAYQERCELLGPLGVYTEGLLHQLVEMEGLTAHSITHRVKAHPSAVSKFCREDRSYSSLNEIHDLLGLRIITFFPDEVDRIAQIVEQEFDLLPEESVDRRAALDPDRFGYISLHYVVRLHADRLRLKEHRRFKDTVFEVQIRSILQHAWAEIEHDLGYKTKQAIPRTIERRFARLAGLLELADAEFEAIRDEVGAYQERVEAEIGEPGSGLGVDRDSLSAFIDHNAALRRIDTAIATIAGGRPLDDPPISWVSIAAAQLQSVGVETIDNVNDALVASEDLIVAFATKWLGDSAEMSFLRGIALFYLCYVLLGRTEDVQVAEAWLREHRIGGAGSDHNGLARTLVETFAAVKEGR